MSRDRLPQGGVSTCNFKVLARANALNRVKGDAAATNKNAIRFERFNVSLYSSPLLGAGESTMEWDRRLEAAVFTGFLILRRRHHTNSRFSQIGYRILWCTILGLTLTAVAAMLVGSASGVSTSIHWLLVGVGIVAALWIRFGGILRLKMEADREAGTSSLLERLDERIEVIDRRIKDLENTDEPTRLDKIS